MEAIQSAKWSLSIRLAELPQLSREQLIDLWIEHMGQPPPKAASTSLLLRAVAYTMQEHEHGGLKRHDQRVLLKIAGAANSGGVRAQRGWETAAAGSARSSGSEPRSGLGAGRSAANGEDTSPAASVRTVLRPGTRLIREWQGRSHAVDVRNDGFGWNGEVYRSLSAVALAITGARWSGNRFFRL